MAAKSAFFRFRRSATEWRKARSSSYSSLSSRRTSNREKSLAAKSMEAQIADLEKDLASVRAVHVEVEAARAAAVEQSATLAKS